VGPGAERRRQQLRQQAEAQGQEAAITEQEASEEELAAQMDDMELLKDRNKSFEAFRKSYRRNEVIESQKSTLREKYGSAKATGEVVNAARAKINSLKARIEQRRVERAMQAVANSGEAEGEDPEEAAMKAQMEAEKARYKENFEQLKKFKAEIEHIQHLLESSRVRLQKDFESWFETKVGGVKKERADVRAQARADERAAARGGGAHVSASLPVHQPQLSTSTGNAEADADIAAFYAAREQLLANSTRSQS